MNHLQLVDPDTGELVAPGCRACHEHTAKIAGLEADLDALAKELTTTIRERDSARKDRDRDRLKHRRRVEVEDIHREWQEITGKRGKLGAARFDSIVARLNNDYERQHFTLAALGAVHNNPWVRSGKSPMVEIETYCRKETWFEVFVNAGAEWQNRVRSEVQVQVVQVVQVAPAPIATAGGAAHKEDPS